MLPKISHPTFKFSVPSTEKPIHFRPMTVKEEKVLLIAKQSGELGEILSAIKQILNVCVTTENFNISELALFDVEYLFLKLRSVSVDNISKVIFRDNDDGLEYPFDIDLSKVEVQFPKNVTNTIKISETMSITLGYPTAELYTDSKLLDYMGEKLVDLIISKCVKRIFDGDTSYDLKDYTTEEVFQFLESLDIKTYEKIKEFFNDMPQMKYELKYKNSLGTEKVIVLKTLDDFFVLG